jgi:hypothetical protein
MRKDGFLQVDLRVFWRLELGDVWKRRERKTEPEEKSYNSYETGEGRLSPGRGLSCQATYDLSSKPGTHLACQYQVFTQQYVIPSH